MCNLYSLTAGQQAIRALVDVMTDRTGDLPSMPGIFPDHAAPVVRNGAEGRELVLARWSLPSAAFALKGRAADLGMFNVRNTASPHWRRWLGVENRCVVPFTSFNETAAERDAAGRKPPVWFALDETRPLAVFAGLWTRWTWVRKVRDGETTDDLFGFLTTAPDAELGAVQPKAMPVILTTRDEVDAWLGAPTAEAPRLQRPLPDGALRVVARGERHDRPHMAP